MAFALAVGLAWGTFACRGSASSLTFFLDLCLGLSCGLGLGSRLRGVGRGPTLRSLRRLVASAWHSSARRRRSRVMAPPPNAIRIDLLRRVEEGVGGDVGRRGSVGEVAYSPFVVLGRSKAPWLCSWWCAASSSLAEARDNECYMLSRSRARRTSYFAISSVRVSNARSANYENHGAASPWQAVRSERLSAT